MPVIQEITQKGHPRSLANLIANIESEGCPYLSMIRRGMRPKQAKHEWQVKVYPRVGHGGVRDGVDATTFQSNPREEIAVYAQKSWYNPGVSDFAEEAEVAGLAKGEFAEQVADAFVAVKRVQEMRALSNSDTLLENGTTNPYETRGIFSWLSSSAQTTLSVPEDFRTQAAQKIGSSAGANLSDFSEQKFIDACAESYITRKGTYAMHTFLGVKLKAKFTNFAGYVDNIANTTPIRRYNQDADSKTLVRVIDKLVLDSGEHLLHLTPFLLCEAGTGADTAFTHRSGFSVDLNMAFLAYTREPRIVNLPYKGGGKKAIVDTIFLHGMENVQGGITMEYNAD